MTIMLAESRIPHEECERPLPVRSHVLAAELPRKPPVASRERVLVVNSTLVSSATQLRSVQEHPIFWAKRRALAASRLRRLSLGMPESRETSERHSAPAAY